MKIPLELLDCPTAIRDVEELLAAEGAPDLWLKQWHRLISLIECGDELWEYCGVTLLPGGMQVASYLYPEESGYDDLGSLLEFDNQFWEYRGATLPEGRKQGGREVCIEDWGYIDCGYALVRGGEIVDAISTYHF